MRLKDELEARGVGPVSLKMAMPGALDVYIDGRRVFSKREAGRYPTVDELLAGRANT